MAQKALLLVLLVILSFVGWQTAQKMRDNLALVKEISTLEGEIEGLRTKNIGLLDFLEYVKSDAFLEKEARLKFGLGKPGEKQVVILSPEKSARGARLPTSERSDGGQGSASEENLSNPSRWWRYFFKNF